MGFIGIHKVPGSGDAMEFRNQKCRQSTVCWVKNSKIIKSLLDLDTAFNFFQTFNQESPHSLFEFVDLIELIFSDAITPRHLIFLIYVITTSDIYLSYQVTYDIQIIRSYSDQ